MSHYKRYAIAGASGSLGTHFMHAFDTSPHGFDVTILTRKVGGNELFAREWLKKGAKIRGVDYEDEESLVEAFNGIDVVISTLGVDAFALQVPIVKAAKKAGVKLYVNSHWGSPLTAKDLPEFAPVDELRTRPLRVAEEVGLPWVEFSTGTFPEYCLPIPLFGLSELKDGKATIYGDGKAQNSWTTQHDVARFVLHVLRHLPPEELQNRRFHIEGDAKSFNEIVQLYEKKYPGSSVKVTYKPLSDLEDKMKNGEGDERFYAALFLAIVQGKAKHKPETLDNKLYPEWHPKGVEYVL